MPTQRPFKHNVETIGHYRRNFCDVVGLSREVFRGGRPEQYGQKDFGALWSVWENEHQELAGTFSLNPYQPPEGGYWRRVWHNV